MCKLSNTYILDLADNGGGAITFNVANSLPQLMNQPCKIVVKQIQSLMKTAASVALAIPIDLTTAIYLRIVHNINIQSGSNYPGFSNSNILSFIDVSQMRDYTSSTASTDTIGFTISENKLFCPNGLPAILTLNRRGWMDGVANDLQLDTVTLKWTLRLEITVNPDQD